MKGQKVFNIGFHRSGTTSLQTALEELGYSVIGMRDGDWDAYARGDFHGLRETVESFDGFRDMPWPLVYQWAYHTFPNAKFVLTYRDPDSWASSCVGNYKNRYYRMFPVIYGFEVFQDNEKSAKDVYCRHIEAVREFFKDKPNSFLEVDFTRYSEWDDICRFLGESIPDRPFPHANNRPKKLYRKVFCRVLRAVSPAYYRQLVRDKK
ncbi:sulfotransferase family protein [Spiribacter vilamensis]|uniref:Sulfotransferase family protein n=1 Tax=Spiribacter vilamensis TaxID=531306 RepID=A0A4Q8D198_9GAMM|nr:sulfotransferase family protein [Spiribacter vilamensis]RZU99098.1 hypothetical protein EV698_1377 [Spiribacter vilamensis]TVO61905.1 sulfotransferase [Spiribacter vilamensis]